MIQNNTRGKKRTRYSKRKLLLQFYNFITLLFVITLFIFYPFSIFCKNKKIRIFYDWQKRPESLLLIFFVRMQLPCKLWIIQITGKIMTWRIMILSCHLISFKFFLIKLLPWNWIDVGLGIQDLESDFSWRFVMIRVALDIGDNRSSFWIYS